MVASAQVSAMLYNTRVAPVLSYISQMFYLPKHFKNKQRHALLRILHLPGNALSTDACHDLANFSCPAFRSSIVENLASLVRMATQTVTSWRFWFVEFRSLAMELLPLQRAMDGHIEPAFWDSRSIICNLHDAYCSYPARPAVKTAIDSFYQQGGINGSDPRCWKKGLQSAVSRVITPTLHPPSLVRLIAGRVSNLVGVSIDPSTVSTHLAFLTSLPLRVRLTSIKTLIGGWTTSIRMHESERLPCIFGCIGVQDELQHYLSCGRLRRAVRHATHLTPPSSPIEFRGFKNKVSSVCCLYVAFNTYHSTRNRYKHEIMRALRDREYALLAAHVKGEACAAFRAVSSSLSPLGVIA